MMNSTPSDALNTNIAVLTRSSRGPHAVLTRASKSGCGTPFTNARTQHCGGKGLETPMPYVTSNSKYFKLDGSVPKKTESKRKTALSNDVA